MLGKGLVLLGVALLCVVCAATPVLAHEVIYDFPLDWDPGWTTEGGWEFGSLDYCGIGCVASTPFGPHTGSYMYGHRLSDGTESLPAPEKLTTILLNCTGWENVTLSFWRMLGVSYYTDASVQVSNDGSSWTTVWSSGGARVVDAEWTLCSYDLSGIADDRPMVYVRWSVGPTTNDICYCYGLDIDDIQVTGDRMPPNELIYNFPLSYYPGWTATGGWEWGPDADCCAGAAYTGPSWYSYVKGVGWPSGTYGDWVTDPLTTTAIDCTGLTDVHLSFWRMLGLADGDEASVQVSNNGTTWTTVWSTQAWLVDWGWNYCEYDISAVADNQPTVYVRWVMGPTDGACGCYGWNIDDVQITAKTAEPPLQILAWVPYVDATWEYPNTLAAITASYGDNFVVSESYNTSDVCGLMCELRGKQVFLVPEPEGATSADLAAAGAALGPALQWFADQGGTVIVCGEFDDGWNNHTGFMTATGLMTATYADVSWGGEPLTTVLPGVELSNGLPGTFPSSNATGNYLLGPESTAVVEDAAGHAAFAYRDFGFGAAIIIGYDYFAWDSNAAQVIANALQYPGSKQQVVLTDCPIVGIGAAKEALNRLHLPYTIACLLDLDWALSGGPWDVVAIDMPGYPVSAGASTVPSYVASGGKVALSNFSYDTQPDLCAAFGVAAGAGFVTPLPVYRWDLASPIFTNPCSVPDLLERTDIAYYNGNYLTVTGADAQALAGYTATPTEGQAAIVMANEGRTIVNGFLWDDPSPDADLDAVKDNVELVMNEIVALLRRLEADFSASFSGTYGPLPVDFTDLSTNRPLEWAWDFGDGYTSAERDPSHTYTSVGSFTVSLTASNEYNSDTETKPDFIVVTLIPPVAAFSGTPTSGFVPLNVTFTDLSTNGPTSWAWDFGDGGTSTLASPTHSYGSVGLYTVTLTATNAAGSDTETKTDYITVLLPPPVAAFSGAPTSGIVPLDVTFTDQSTGVVTAWAWDFGDTGTSIVQHPTHQYTAVGTYTVVLMVSNAGGFDTETKPDYITVLPPPPVAAFSGTPTLGAAPLNVAFTDASTGVIDSWEWNFGDTTTSTDQNPTHQYATVGTYTVSLEVTNPGGSDTETKTNYIQAVAPIAAGFSATGTVGIVPLEASFTDLSSGTPTAWSWNFGDATTSTDKNPTHTYTEPGYYTVALTASKTGATDTETKVGFIAAGFTDTPPESNAFYQILACVQAGVVQGYGDGTYHPERSVNRGQMAIYISRAVAGGDSLVPEPAPGTQTFPDVGPENVSYYKYVEYCAAKHIVQGFWDGNYKPDKLVNRGQMAMYIARALVQPGGDAAVPLDTDGPTFPDVIATGDTALFYNHVEYLAGLEVVEGFWDGLYHPDRDVRRDQMALYVQRAFDYPIYPQ